jgi:zinc finger protein ubi-d4
MLEMDAYDEPDPDSDLDYEETYSKRSKRRKTTGRVIKLCIFFM